MPTTSGLINHTLATLTNRTVTSIYLNTTSLPPRTTAIPLNHSHSLPNSNGSLPGNPHCLNCYPNFITIGPPLITYTYSYPYDYAYYAFILILVVAAFICIKISLSRRKELERQAAAQRRRARQQAEGVNVQTAAENNNSNSNNQPGLNAKDFDLPPAYDEVIQSYILNKQQEQHCTNNNTSIEVATTHPSTNSLTAGVSTITIETEISNSNHASTITLNNTNAVTK